MAIAYVSVGKTVKGASAMLRPSVANAWNLLVAVVKLDLGIDLSTRVIQALGGAAESAGTHSDGAAVDVRVWGLTKVERARIVLLARECGFPASWDRPWGGNEHLHLGADVHNAWTRVDYQVIAVKDGYNGLGSRGRGGKDDGPRPSAWRNTVSGALWANQYIVTSITKEFNNMTPEQLIDAFMSFTITANGKDAPLKQHFADLFVATQAQSVAVATEAKRDSAHLQFLVDFIKERA